MPQAPLIAIDLDDVLCQTNAAAAKWHNEVYRTRVVIDDFHYYHWWKNPGWGDPLITKAKAQMFYASLHFLEVTPVLGVVDAMQALTALGFRLAIVTTRSLEHREHTIAWINKWLPGVFESIHFTGEFVNREANHRVAVEEGFTKGEICRELAASLLIDDSVENVLGCGNAPTGQTLALLFGDYEWGKRTSTAETAEDMMSFDQRQQHELTLGRSPEWWKGDTIQLPEGVWRVKDWSEVLLWLQSSGKDVVNTQHV